MAEAAGLYYEEHGPPDGAPLILSSGLGGSAKYWAPNIPALADYFRVIAYDHRGTGRSDRALPDVVTVEQMGQDIVALLDALDIGQAAIVGHAAGAAAALSVSLTAPSRMAFMVLVNGWSKPDPHFLRCFDARLALLRHAGAAAYLAAQPIFLYPAPWISTHDAELRAETAEQLAHFPGADVFEKRIAALAAFDVDDRLGEIATPTIALAAEDDMLVPYTCSERLHAGIPGAELAMMRWGGHACNVSDPATFNQLLLEILSGE